MGSCAFGLCSALSRFFKWIFGSASPSGSFDLAEVEPFKTALADRSIPRRLEECRSTHDDLLERRSDLLERSQKAYKGGQGREAKQLSQEARELTEKIDRLAILLSYYEFIQRDQGQMRVISKSDPPGVTYDLHGQTRRHVVTITQAILEHHHNRRHCPTSQATSPVYLIVGAGNHSEGGKVVLRPVLEEFLGNYCGSKVDSSKCPLVYSFDGRAIFTVKHR